MNLLIAAFILTHAQGIPFNANGMTHPSSACTNPTTTNMKFWYQGYNASNTCSGGCSTGNAFTAIPDLSGNANNAVMGNAPTYQASSINGLGGIHFASASGNYLTPTDGTNGFTSTGSTSIFALIKLRSTGTEGTIISGDAGASLAWHVSLSGKYQNLDETSTQALLTGTAAETTTAKYVDVIYTNSTSVAFGINAVSDGTTSTCGSSCPNITARLRYLGIHAGGAGQNLDADIVEIFGYTGAVNNTVRDAARTYLACVGGL